MMVWAMLDPRMTPDHLGLIPYMLDEHDPRPAREQFDANYAHGGGWRPMTKFQRLDDNSIKYPGDPPHKPLATTHFREEQIFFYDSAWVMILQEDGSFEVSRMD